MYNRITLSGNKSMETNFSFLFVVLSDQTIVVMTNVCCNYCLVVIYLFL